MTLNQKFDEVTFWEVNQAKKHKMLGRILPGEDKLLKAYLYPNLDDKEAKEVKALREKKITQQNALLSADNFGIGDDDEEEIDEGLADELGARMAARGGLDSDSDSKESDEKSSKVTDDEKESDSDFMDRMDLNEDPDHMDQRQKGLRIEDIGGVHGLDIKK